MATQQQFIDFLSEIEPSPTTKSVCVSAHSKLRAKLETHETYKDIHVNTYLSGSYARVRQTDGTVRRCTLSTRAELWQRKQLRLRLLQFAANTQGSNAFDYFPVDRTNKGEVRQPERNANLAQMKAEFHSIIEAIRAQVVEYGNTEKDIFGVRRGRTARTPVAPVAAKYRGPKTGATWSRRGRAPAWPMTPVLTTEPGQTKEARGALATNSHDRLFLTLRFCPLLAWTPVPQSLQSYFETPSARIAAIASSDLLPTNRASRSLVKFVFGEEDEHEEALYGTANHRVSEGS